MTGNTNLHKARKARLDEFYTRLEDIEKELQHYPGAFRDKVVYLNTDDPKHSQFWAFFNDNFATLGLKELVATKYPEGLLFRLKTAGGTVEVVELEGDGDFRSPECVAVLEQADIVVTNPPFSLFREYIGQLMEYGKKFLVIGNMNAITYKKIWPYIQAGDLWLGVTRFGTGQMWFEISEGAPTATGQIVKDGVRYQTVGSTAWFTNLDHHRRHQPLPLSKTYTPEEYPHYDNYDAIEVSQVKHIPGDYDGVMGVPITFFGKWNPDQFEIVAYSRKGHVPESMMLHVGLDHSQPYVLGKAKYARIFIRRINQLGETK